MPKPAAPKPAAPPPSPAVAPSPGPALAALVDPALVPVGPIVPPHPIKMGAAVGLPALRDGGQPYEQTLASSFDSVTPENEMKMDALAPARGRWSFGAADQFVSLAERLGKSVRGHTLVWHDQLPGWLTSRTWTRDELLGVMRDHIKAVMGHYRGRVAEWDVVNEPFEADGSLRHSIWLDVIGRDYIDYAFRWARAADPSAKLYLNDFDVEKGGAKGDALTALAGDLVRRGVPIDGVGFQMHVQTTFYPSRAELDLALRRMTDLGLDVEITEMDVGSSETPGTEGERDAAAAEVYRLAAEACQGNARCSRFTTWGVSDKSTWRGTAERPLLFDTGFAAKPAYEIVRSILMPAR